MPGNENDIVSWHAQHVILLEGIHVADPETLCDHINISRQVWSL